MYFASNVGTLIYCTMSKTRSNKKSHDVKCANTTFFSLPFSFLTLIYYIKINTYILEHLFITMLDTIQEEKINPAVKNFSFEEICPYW